MSEFECRHGEPEALCDECANEDWELFHAAQEKRRVDNLRVRKEGVKNWMGDMENLRTENTRLKSELTWACHQLLDAIEDLESNSGYNAEVDKPRQEKCKEILKRIGGKNGQRP
jgi:hypothetical protein